MGAVVPTTGMMARCTIHGGTYRVLFDRSRVARAAAADGTDTPFESPGSMLGLSAPRARTPEVPCARHPEALTTVRCANCRAAVCATCDFAFEGDLHFCPDCATSSQSAPMSKKRVWKIVASMGLALLATIAFPVLIVASALARGSAEALGVLFVLVTLAPAVAGIVIGLGANDRALPVSWSARGAVAWNAMLIAGFFLLYIIGLLRG
jgi:hypothetical protein